MKRTLLFLSVLISLYASAQTPPANYLYRATRERTIAGFFDSTAHGPAGAFPSLRTGGATRAGAIFTDTVGGGQGFQYYRGGTWRRVVDSSELADTAAAIRASSSGGSATTDSITYAQIDSLVWRAVISLRGNSLIEQQPGLSQGYSRLGDHLAIANGIGGATIDFIYTAFKQDTLQWYNPTVLWVCRNNIGTHSSVYLCAYIDSFINRMASVGNTRYWVVDELNGGGEGTGTSQYDSIIALNNRIHARYPGHSGALREFMVSKYNPSSGADVANHSADIVPLSLRADSLHPNTTGYNWVAYFIDSAGRSAMYDTSYKSKFMNAQQIISLTQGRLQHYNLSKQGSYNIDNRSIAYMPDPYTAPNSIVYGNGGRHYITGAANNYIAGWNANRSGTTAFDNVIIGTGSGDLISTGGRNVYAGTFAGTNMLVANDNTAVGWHAMLGGGAGSGLRNTAIGSASLAGETTGNDNTAVGQASLQTNSTGTRNTAFGRAAGASIATASDMTAIGQSSQLPTTVGGNSSVGSYSLANNTTGGKNTVMGMAAFYSNQTGSRNVSLGDSTGWGQNGSGISLNGETFLGSAAGLMPRSGADSNTFVGSNVVRDSITGDRNLAIGNNIELPSRTESYQMNLGSYIIGRGGSATSAGAANTGRIGIGTNNPDASAILDLTSTNKGLLVPRLTTTQQNAISSPATGLLIFNTDSSSHFQYTGSAWQNLRSSSGGGGGGGGVSNVATGLGLTGGPITSTGTIAADTSVGTGIVMWPRLNKRTDSLIALLSGGGGANTALSNLSSVAINTSLLPGSNDGAALGSGSLAFSDLFLASGGVVNWNNGNYTATHSSGSLNFSTGTNVFTISSTTSSAQSQLALTGGTGGFGQINNTIGDLYLTAAAGSSNIILRTANSERWRINPSGNFTNTGGTGTAYIHVKAGTATASTAPLKLTSGTNNTTPEAGAIEYDGTNFYATNSSAARGIVERSVLTLSSAGTLSLSPGVSYYVFNGTTTTWTLPSVSGLPVGTQFNIKNRGTGNITLNSNAGGNDMYGTIAASSVSVIPGAALQLVFDGTYFSFF